MDWASILDSSILQKILELSQEHWWFGLSLAVIIGYAAVQVYKLIRAVVKLALLCALAAGLFYAATWFIH